MNIFYRTGHRAGTDGRAPDPVGTPEQQRKYMDGYRDGTRAPVYDREGAPVNRGAWVAACRWIR